MERLKTILVASVLLCACTTEARQRGDGLDPATIPENVRADYELFAHRCSKCHSLARPLQSGITDDEFWKAYVDRMRRQPGSGISPDDATVILRFLHYYSQAQKEQKDQ